MPELNTAMIDDYISEENWKVLYEYTYELTNVSDSDVINNGSLSCNNSSCEWQCEFLQSINKK